MNPSIDVGADTPTVSRGILHLLPVPIAADSGPAILPARTLEAMFQLGCFVVENARSARRALKELGHPGPMQQLDIREIPAGKEQARLGESVLADLLAPLTAGHAVGVLSESGCPGIADPGAELARWAQRNGHAVQPHVGPSSLLLALMGSGLEGQRFSFHGYLPVDGPGRIAALQALELRSRQERAAQLFIETPYRNDAMVQALLTALQPGTLVSVACDLTGSAELLRTRSVRLWRESPPLLPRLPTVFLLQALSAPAASPRRRA
ncbi:MAG: SAM-dependent methyltransferase [Pseudomonadota bacterium]|nr:SAM-dependent methyltransferase [Pseudomonadota bacterium]